MTCRVILTAAALMTGSAIAGAQQPPTFSSSTRLVTVAVSVADQRTGAPVRGLSREDFIVESGGTRRPIVQFTGDPGPVTVAVLLDASASMAVNQVFEPAHDAAMTLLDALTPGEDRAAAYTFDQQIAERHPFAPASPAQARSLTDVHAFGSTSLYDAVQSVSEAAARDANPRRGVVIYTDGLDNSSLSRASDVRALASSLDVPLYLLAVLPADTPARGGYVTLPATHPLQSLADGTGGRLFAATPGVGIGRAHEEILASLRLHYVLAFEPDVRPGWHSLTVRTRAAHTVRARAGYVVTPRS